MSELDESRRKTIFSINSKEYSSVTECCNDLNIDYEKFVRYYKENSYRLETCIYRYLKECKDRTVIVNGVKYKSLNDCCRQFNLEYGTVIKCRDRKGITSSEAVQLYL